MKKLTELLLDAEYVIVCSKTLNGKQHLEKLKTMAKKMTTSTKPQNHSERDHALLSASGASRWINCTPSAKLEEAFGPRETSVYAQEGTLAHELAELYIRHDVLQTVDDQEFSDRFDEIMNHQLFSEEMLEVVPIYVDYCTAQYHEALADNPLAVMEIEQKLDLTEFVPESFGTADCVVINDSILEVIDLKYGKGVPVYAAANKQGMLYALGALRKYDVMYDIEEVRITIVQPRINNISTWLISVEDLLEWANEKLKPAAEKAFAGEGELLSGDWCKFCAVKNRCRALYEKNVELAKYDFQEPALLTDEEIADILERAPQLIEWANSVQEYAQDQAVNHNKVWPGFKLVEGVSRRKWLDEDKVAEEIFNRFPEATEDQIFDMKLKTITQVEKLFGKKAVSEQLSDVIVKPQGKPTLVPVSDKRAALGTEDAINDFK